MMLSARFDWVAAPAARPSTRTRRPRASTGPHVPNPRRRSVGPEPVRTISRSWERAWSPGGCSTSPMAATNSGRL